ncbi:MAG: phage replisome organizer N-terminal domain-containing protein [Clostridia bacterium]|nr:phage replisome organizer N-terminal domain-containing protein [Clostridia bacterium]
MAGKRYFWLKLPEDFFRRGYIRRLRSMKDGDRLVLIYLEMLLAALKTEGLIACDGAEDPAEELALELFESPEEVSRVLAYCTEREKAAWEGERRFRLTDCAEMTGSEGDSAKRMRDLRRREEDGPEGEDDAPEADEDEKALSAVAGFRPIPVPPAPFVPGQIPVPRMGNRCPVKE